jgi:hypothetical protein
MEFLVHITIALSAGIPSDELQALDAAESARAASLADPRRADGASPARPAEAISQIPPNTGTAPIRRVR